MENLLIALMCALAVSKATLQSHYANSRGLGTSGNLFYNFIMFTAIAILFLPVLLIKGCSVYTLVFAIITGVLSVGFQFTYMLSFANGKPSLVTTINNFSMFIPIGVSALFLHEPFDLKKGIALVIASVSIILITYKRKGNEKNSSGSNKWLIYTFLAFLFNGFCSANQKLYPHYEPAVETFSFVAIAYITAAVISFVIYLFVKIKTGESYTDKKGATLSAAGAGLFLGIFQCVNTYAVSVVSGVILFPVFNCATAVLFVLVRLVFFKEKLTKNQLIGIILSLFAIVLMQ